MQGTLLAGEVADVLAATGEEPRRLAELAAALFRDPHALDRPTPLGRACVRSLELLTGLGDSPATCAPTGTSSAGGS